MKDKIQAERGFRLTQWGGGGGGGGGQARKLQAVRPSSGYDKSSKKNMMKYKGAKCKASRKIFGSEMELWLSKICASQKRVEEMVPYSEEPPVPFASIRLNDVSGN